MKIQSIKNIDKCAFLEPVIHIVDLGNINMLLGSNIWHQLTINGIAIESIETKRTVETYQVWPLINSLQLPSEGYDWQQQGTNKNL